MPIFRSSGPRLVPELDDSKLGRVRKQLATPASAGLTEIQVDSLEQVLREPGKDWDRRGHRFGVLAESPTAPPLARAWRLRRPRSGDAAIFEAWVLWAQARRTGRPDDPQALLATCYRAAELVPDDPAPWVVCLGVMRLLKRDQREVFPVWREIVVRDQWNREAHLEMLGYLSPEECGSQAQTLEFVDSVESRLPPGAPVSALRLISVVEQHQRTLARGGVDALLAGRQWTHLVAASALDRAATEWTKPGFLRHAATLADLNLLAYALSQAGRLTEAAEAFRLAGRVVTPWPWQLLGDPVQWFVYWRDQALR